MNRTIYDIENEIVYCTRCGIAESFETVYKRKIRDTVNAEWCRDCRDDRPFLQGQYKWTHPVLGQIYCSLWDGELDDFWQPVTQDGELYRPGARLCGKKDCVRKTHIIEKDKQ